MNSGRRVVWACLVGVAAGVLVLAAARSHLGGFAFPFFVGAFLLAQLFRRPSQRFPGTEFERGLERLFALLIPGRKATSSATALARLQRYRALMGLRRGVRRWAKELELISTDGYDTTSRISSLHVRQDHGDDRILVAETVSALSAERASAGADPTLTHDPVALLAYGLGARPAAADLASLDVLLDDLGLTHAGQDLRTHFDDVIAEETRRLKPRPATPKERNMFRDLAGASFVLGASARIIELASGRGIPTTPIETRAA